MRESGAQQEVTSLREALRDKGEAVAELEGVVLELNQELEGVGRAQAEWRRRVEELEDEATRLKEYQERFSQGRFLELEKAVRSGEEVRGAL